MAIKRLPINQWTYFTPALHENIETAMKYFGAPECVNCIFANSQTLAVGTYPEWTRGIAIAGQDRRVDRRERSRVRRIRAVDVVDVKGSVRVVSHKVVQPEA